MILLYGLLSLMLVAAIFLLLMPVMKTKEVQKKSLLVIVLVMIIFSLGLYSFTNHSAALKEWMQGGKEHYELLMQYQQLGGLDGLIQRVSKKAEANPNDAQGWYILGKLYLMKRDYPQAKKVLEKAHLLKPEDGQIEYFYEMAKQTH